MIERTLASDLWDLYGVPPGKHFSQPFIELCPRLRKPDFYREACRAGWTGLVWSIQGGGN